VQRTRCKERQSIGALHAPYETRKPLETGAMSSVREHVRRGLIRIRRRGSNVRHRWRPAVEWLEDYLLLTGVIISDFPVPIPPGTAFPPSLSGPNITSGPDGNLWFTEGSGSIGMINPTTHNITAISPTLPANTNFVQFNDMTSGTDGNLWFTDLANNAVGMIKMINPTTYALTEYGIPTAACFPVGITTGPDGNLWFTEFGANQIGTINPRTDAITEFPVPTAGSGPNAITAGADGNVSFTETNANQIGMINPTTDAITEFSIPTVGGVPGAITAGDAMTAGPDGNIWFTESGSNQIAMIDSTTHAITAFPLPATSQFGQWSGVTAGPDGNVWFTEGFSDQIGMISPTTHVIASFSIPDSGFPAGITAGPDGNLWFSQMGVPVGVLIGELQFSLEEADTTTLLAGANPSTYGQNVTFTATVSSQSGGIPTGTVTFNSDGPPQPPVTLSIVDGQTVATFSASLGVGPHSIGASYSGDRTFAPSTVATPLSQIVDPATPTVSATDAGGIFDGAPFPATATVAGVIAGVDNSPSTSLEGVSPTLAYYAGADSSGIPLNGPPTGPGTYTVLAVFPGSADYASAAASTTFTISPNALASVAIPIALGSSTTGTLAAGDVVFYQINAAIEGELVAQVHAENGKTRLSLLNAQDQVLMQSDGQSATNPDDLIGLDVPAGPEFLYLELANLDGASAYRLTTSLTPSTLLLQPGTLPSAYQGSSSPSDLVARDFTGDGRTDLAVDLGADVLVLLGNGDGTFQPPVSYAVGNGPGAIVSGDFNDDGRTDLAVVNHGSNNVSVLLGNGDGTFQPQVTYQVGHTPWGIVAGDFTGNGRTDLAVTNLWDGTVSVLLGNGDGTFQRQVIYRVGNEPRGIVAGDFTGDGRTGLAITNYGSSTVSVLLGNGDGTFQPQATYAVGSHPNGIVAGDFTGDGRLDLATADGYSNDVSVLLGNGDGTFQPQVAFPVGGGPLGIVAGDFTGDGRTDLAVADSGSGDVSVLLGNGDGTFRHAITYTVGGSSRNLVCGDFNGDGRTDLAVASGSAGDVALLFGNGDGTFQDPIIDAVGSSPVGVVTGDFNDDGRTDLAVVNSNDNDISVLLGNGDGTFQNQVTYAVGSGPAAIVAGDFNGDGRLDLAVANSNDDDISVLLGNGDGTFQAAVQYPVGTTPVALVAGDFTGDGRLDLATANQGSNDVSVLLGNGNGTFQPQVTYAVGLWPGGIVAGDFNGDGRLDLAVTNQHSNDVSILLGNGDGTFQAQATYGAGTNPDAITTGDFTGDDRLDLAIANYYSNDVSVLLGNGDGTFQSQVTYAVGSSPGGVVAADLTGDGRLDLAVNLSANVVAVFPGNGDGTFQSQVTYAVGTAPSRPVAADFTGDGRLDLVTANAGSDDLSLLLNLNGTFAAPGSLVINAHPSPLLADLTGDGVDDVLVVNAAGDILWRKGQPQDPGTFDPPVTINPGHPSRDIVAVNTNQGPLLASVDATDDAISFYAWSDGSFAVIGSLATGSLPAQIVAGDLTGDGWNDLVVRNAGDGTLSVYLSASFATGPSSALPFPFLPAIVVPVGLNVSDVTLADTSGDGSTDIIVTNTLTGEVGVVRNLGPGFYDPAVLYRASSGLYGVTSTGDRSKTITTFEATAGVAAGTFTVGGPPSLVAINPGSNTFSLLGGLGGGRFANPVTLPTPSPAIAVRVADLEGNGIPDAILLSASGVTVYRGDGKGGFLPDPFTIDAGPDPTGMTVADLNHDGKPDVLVSNAFGDLLVLLGNGDGTFQPYYKADQQVALAVLPNGSATPDFIYADQGLDNVVVDYSGGQTTTVADRSSGLLAPGAVQLADLNGDGIPDLIVANSGSNNVLVYPGLGNGQFGPELNGGHGFFTGTDPVSITVANLNGRPDLLIANEGSNDVSILLNEPTADGGFTFVLGPRLQGGPGPTSTVVENLPGDPFPDLLISDGGSNQVRLLRGVGGGFFNDQNPTIYSVGSAPVQVMVGTFTPGPGPQIATINRGSNDVTVISDFNSPAPVFQSFPTGGVDPVAAFGVDVNGTGFESLVVANSGDGLFTLLGGTDGLAVEATLSAPALPQPSAVVLAGVNQDAVDFYATTAGVEAAYALEFILPGRAASLGPISVATVTEGSTPLALPPVTSFSPIPGGAQLLPLNEAALPLVGTLLTVGLATGSSATPTSPSPSASPGPGVSTALIALLPETGPPSGQEQGPGSSPAAIEAAVAVASPAAPSSSAGQSLLNPGNTPEKRSAAEDDGNPQERPSANRSPQSPTPWTGFLPGRDEVLEEIRQGNQPAPSPSGSEPPEAEPDLESTGGAPHGVQAVVRAIDEAICSLWPVPRGQSTESVSVSTPLVLTAILIVRSTHIRRHDRTKAGTSRRTRW
jgi:streptogramin lyase